MGAIGFAGHFAGAPNVIYSGIPTDAATDGYRLGVGLEIRGERNRFLNLKLSQETHGRFSDRSALARFGVFF
jgi:hypothetical protein